VAITFCISASETKGSEMLSRLPLRTSMMAGVMASAFLVGAPCDLGFLTCDHHLWSIRSGKHFNEHPSSKHPNERREAAFAETARRQEDVPRRPSR
jgi:hypothetical protein